MQEKKVHTLVRSNSIDISWPGATFWKCSVVVLLVLIVLLHAPLWLRGIGDEAQGEVVEAYIHKSTRARSVPSVLLVFTYPSNGEIHTTTELYQPRKSGSSNWGEEEYAAAQAFIDRHPRGKAITVWVPRYVPWEASVLPAITTDASRHIGRWMATMAVVVVYVLLLVGGVVAVGALRGWWQRRSESSRA